MFSLFKKSHIHAYICPRDVVDFKCNTYCNAFIIPPAMKL